MVEPLGDWHYTWPFLAGFIGAYLIGSIPFGLLVTRLAGLGDIRHIGSGNIGATNVLRTGRKGLALLTLVLDGGKGAAVVLAARTFGPDMAVLAAAGAVLGHCLPVWLKFKGGKGMATFLGALLALAPWVGVAACVTWLVVAVVLRYSSLATLVAALASPAYAFWLADWQRMEMIGIMTVLVVLRHHANIRRLIRGQEPKIGRGKRAGDSAGNTTAD